MFIIGLDLGKRKSQLCVQDGDGVVLAELRVDTTRDELIDALAKYRGARVLIEASTSSEWVARVLESDGFDVIVADPRFSLMYAQRDKKVKTDRRDARALADAVRLKAFRPAHRKSDAARRLQGKLVVRKQLVGTRAKMIIVVRAMCEREGIIVPRCHAENFVNTIDGMQMEQVLFELIGPALEQIASLTKLIETLDQELEAVAKGNPVAKILRTVRGVGPITALAFISVVDNPARFKSARELSSYLGLVPSERSSGDTRKTPGAITKSGDPMVRAYLFEAAVTLTKKTAPDSHLKSWYLKLVARNAARGTKRRALVALARRLARILFAMWRDNKPFEHSRTAPASSPPAATTQQAA